ncbi:amino acid adenylation domain-containing protein [Catellatospora sp. KI3]|uniref:non-ribosomal peptide synthetase n=1 Tax=Catellatospora sp. KI3 TaxID=3041620 RepID=UPI0024826BAE|nr:non-ribosomal peptide synthetase [Catellatospora sp. KI3]MDI1462547.1 amino acid adenylation domain-containing protein [Catellatospora sp. KI3]
METRASIVRPVGQLWAGVGPALAVPSDCSVLDLFEAAADRHPDRPAVRYRDRELTYRELDRLAEAIAVRLRDAGAVPGGFVPLVVNEGVEFPAALLAAMKVGAPFVPIDPEWPTTRIEGLFGQLAPSAVLAVEATLPVVRAVGADDLVVRADLGPAEQAGEPEPGVRPGPEDLIYGYFTSGSTGTPKCALNRHRGLVNRMASMSFHFGDGADQVVLQNSRPTFDSSMWQVLWPLTTGGLVVMPDRRGILDLEGTCRILAEHGVTITDFVPSVLSALVTLLELRPELRTSLAGLRRMLIGGEEANAAVLRRLRELLPNLRVTNTFGPTECSIGSVFHHIDDLSGRIPLGTPIPNTAAVVLDDEMRPVPALTVGEIYIGGACVGAGYLGDPARTERAFVPNPFPQIGGELLYRTGDLGHHTADGLLMFDGRRDDQVKVGGVRIELAEVERVLSAHPSVQAAAVITRGEGDARSLAAFVVARPGAGIEVGPLLDWLRTELPPETVPQTVTPVRAIPLTSHGKADRKALERIARDSAATGPVEQPASVEEELVAAVWRELLGVGEVSVVASFAGYGGTSLLAHQVATLLTVRCGRPVHVADLLSADTVRAQARLLVDGATGRTALDVSRLRRDADASALVTAQVPRPPQTASRLLLTGATGFIGAHLLAELLAGPRVELVCLVRAADAEQAARRLVEVLRAYRLNDALAVLEPRLADGSVRALPGDLAQAGLGLSGPQFKELAEEIDGVVHAGAMVNFLRDYDGHRAPNVAGTGELIRLATAGKGCRLHVLSTLSVLGGTGADLDGPAALPGLDELPPGGYEQSKLVAEHLLLGARALGVDSVVYRLGEIWPHRVTGVPNPASLAHSIVYAAAATGVVFPTEASTDHLAVDAVARHLAAVAVGHRPATDTVHLVRPSTLRYADVFDHLARAGAQPLGYPEFRRRLVALTEQDGADERLIRVAMLLPPADDAEPAAPPAFDRLFTDSSADPGPAVGTAGLYEGSPLTDLTPFLEAVTARR